jgi:hypothetical protein
MKPGRGLRNERCTAVQRCREEIAECERLLREGHPDLQGLCLALADWSAELRLLEEIRRGSYVRSPLISQAIRCSPSIPRAHTL